MSSGRSGEINSGVWLSAKIRLRCRLRPGQSTVLKNEAPKLQTSWGE